MIGSLTKQKFWEDPFLLLTRSFWYTFSLQYSNWTPVLITLSNLTLSPKMISASSHCLYDAQVSLSAWLDLELARRHTPGLICEGIFLRVLAKKTHLVGSEAIVTAPPWLLLVPNTLGDSFSSTLSFIPCIQLVRIPYSFDLQNIP